MYGDSVSVNVCLLVFYVVVRCCAVGGEISSAFQRSVLASGTRGLRHYGTHHMSVGSFQKTVNTL